MSASDKILFMEFKQGNITSFETLVLRHRQSFVNFLTGYVKSYHLAEEVAQDVFAYIYSNPDRYKMDFEFRTYLYMLGKRRAIDLIRKEIHYQKVPLTTESLIDDTSLVDYVARLEELELLMKHVNQLDDKYRKVINLVYLDGFSVNETARLLEQSVSSVKVQLFRARKSLRKMMLESGYSHENR